MSDLISRSALLAEYDKHHVGAPGGARKLIEEAPTIDAVPVVHGRWEKFNLGIYDFALRLRCSNCHQAVYENGFNYCPNCGAKMEGE